MSNKPFFSVVMPTRDRAKLLPLAVQSVLDQTFGDFEIIISDNFSFDDTPQVAQNFNDERVKYFRSEKSLSIGDSWKFALSHATGEYITFLPDDDAYAGVLLETFHRLIKQENADIVSCNLTPYYMVDTFEYGKKITSQTLLILPFSREVSVLDREQSVAALFSSIGLNDNSDEHKFVRFPQLVNAAYHHSLIEKVKQQIPNIFPISLSDIYTCALFLNVVDKYCYVDEPLYLQCVWSGSLTRGEEAISEKYLEEVPLDYVPLKKLITSSNYMTNIILRAKSDWGDDFLPLELNWNPYFLQSYQDIQTKQSDGVDVSAQLQEFQDLLSKQNPELQKEILKFSSNSKLKDLLKTKLKNTSIGKILLSLKYRHIKTLSSANNNFKNIAECAKQIDESFLNEHAAGEDGIITENKWGNIQFRRISEIGKHNRTLNKQST